MNPCGLAASKNVGFAVVARGGPVGDSGAEALRANATGGTCGAWTFSVGDAVVRCRCQAELAATAYSRHLSIGLTLDLSASERCNHRYWFASVRPLPIPDIVTTRNAPRCLSLATSSSEDRSVRSMAEGWYAKLMGCIHK